MDIHNLDFHHSLVSARDRALKDAQKVFQETAIEAHVFGSVGRHDSDPYSDLDIWFTFKDEIIEDVLAKRFEHYAMVGEVVHVCEAPQNAPVNGVYSLSCIELSLAYCRWTSISAHSLHRFRQKAVERSLER